MMQHAPTRVWAVGLYACLTSWIGHAIAGSRGWRFIDGDETLSELSGRSTMELARAPKSERRDWVSCYVRYLTSETGNIVGSVPSSVADHDGDAQLLAYTGTLVYLRLPVDLLSIYATSDPRQHLSALEVRAWLDRVFDRRDRRLTQLADHVIDVAGGSSDDARAAAFAVNARLRSAIAMPIGVAGRSQDWR